MTTLADFPRWRDVPCPECQEGVIRQPARLRGTLAGECSECGTVLHVEEIEDQTK